ncbi:MAG: enoyl-CoA hydratase/isomerase family protein [Leptospirales bacterium]|jgi:enoyl-CoA hydratase/carnithine racemase
MISSDAHPNKGDINQGDAARSRTQGAATASDENSVQTFQGVRETLRENGVLELTLDLNENNLLSLEAFHNIAATVERWSQDERVKVMVLGSAALGFFSNGLDPRNFYARPEADVREFVRASVSVMERIFFFPVPVICAIPGHCMAAGAVMAICCDYRYMLDRSGRIGYPEANIALNFPGFASRRLRDLIGERATRDLLFDAKLLRPADAQKLGLIDEAIFAESPEDFARQVRARADKLAKVPIVSLRGIKDGLRRDYVYTMQETAIFDVDELVKTVLTPQAQEGILSLIEGRRPKFG